MFRDSKGWEWPVKIPSRANCEIRSLLVRPCTVRGLQRQREQRRERRLLHSTDPRQNILAVGKNNFVKREHRRHKRDQRFLRKEETFAREA